MITEFERHVTNEGGVQAFRVFDLLGVVFHLIANLGVEKSRDDAARAPERENAPNQKGWSAEQNE